MDMMIIASFVILCLVMILAYGRLKRKQKTDSALRQKAVLSANEQLTFSRLKEVIPHVQVLAHVSFDSLLTTKYLHTRRKYQKMVADFVLLDAEYRVIAVIAIDDLNLMKRSKNAAYQDAMLETAGYRMIRYIGVPENEQLREDFLYNMALEQDSEIYAARILHHSQLYTDRIARMRAFS